jgi:hypothetical protein
MEDLHLVYEAHENFAPLPTFFISAGLNALMSSDVTRNAMPNKELNLANVIISSHYIISVVIIKSLCLLIHT